MRLNAEIPDDLAALLRERAEADDLTVAQVVRRALRAHLQPEPLADLRRMGGHWQVWPYTVTSPDIWCSSSVCKTTEAAK